MDINDLDNNQANDDDNYNYIPDENEEANDDDNYNYIPDENEEDEELEARLGYFRLQDVNKCNLFFKPYLCYLVNWPVAPRRMLLSQSITPFYNQDFVDALFEKVKSVLKYFLLRERY